MSDNSGSAFPLPARDGQVFQGEEGLTKRELFAAMAMQSLVSDEAIAEVSIRRKEPLIETIARAAVRFADALIAELSKERK